MSQPFALAGWCVVLMVALVTSCTPPAPEAPRAAQSDLAPAATPVARAAIPPATPAIERTTSGQSPGSPVSGAAPPTSSPVAAAPARSTAAPSATLPAPTSSATPTPRPASPTTDAGQPSIAVEATRSASNAIAAATQVAQLASANATQAAQLAGAVATQTALTAQAEAIRAADRQTANAIVPQAVTAPVQPTVGTFEVFERVKPTVVHIAAEDATSIWTGTGLIIHPDGFIITNNHVAQDARRLTVTLADGRSYPAKVVRAHPLAGLEIFALDGPLKVDYDLAVLKIEASGLPYGVLADSSKVRELEEVIAIGYPLNYRTGGPSVTIGTVSAKRTTTPGGPTLIQMTTTINPGNSGGPLVNRAGQVVGINTWSDRRQGATGINFAISSNDVRDFLSDKTPPEAIAAATQAAGRRR